MITEGGRTVWLAGHLATEDEFGNSLADDFDGQVKCIFRKLSATLEEAGGTLTDIVSMTCFITDVSYNSSFVEIRKLWFKTDEDPIRPRQVLVYSGS